MSAQSGKEWYAEQLKDPRWQRRRLEVMQAADFKCEFCGAADKPLHIHHLKYFGKPWEAPMEYLECLCEGHHASREVGGLLGGLPSVRASVVKAFMEAVQLQVSNGRNVNEVIASLADFLK